MSRGEDTMFDRWARRKRAVAAADAKAAPAPEGPREETGNLGDTELPEAELLEKLGLPDPDTLGAGDDFTAFLKKGVPEFLKKRALRRLWLSNPALSNLDGLLDYGEDFTDAAKVPKILTTAYQVGRGFIRDPKPDSNATAEPPADAAETAAACQPIGTAEQHASPPETAPSENLRPENMEVAQGDENEDEIVEYRPPRMRFYTG